MQIMVGRLSNNKIFINFTYKEDTVILVFVVSIFFNIYRIYFFLKTDESSSCYNFSIKFN